VLLSRFGAALPSGYLGPPHSVERHPLAREASGL
jgi:hypothetical protein